MKYHARLREDRKRRKAARKFAAMKAVYDGAKAASRIHWLRMAEDIEVLFWRWPS